MLDSFKSLFNFIRLLLTAVMLIAPMTPTVASITDGVINSGEYSWDTTTPDSSEIGDGSGGVRWDIDYMGLSIEGNQFSFGIKGGSILGGENTDGSQILWLGDLAIDIGGDGSFDYGVVLGLDSSNNAAFDLYHVAEWSGVNRYNRTDNQHRTETYKIETAYQGLTPQTVQTVNGGYDPGQGDGSFSQEPNTASLGTVNGIYSEGDQSLANFVLEGSFDLGLLSLFDEATGGDVIMYLTMSCVNDEALVYADVSPVTATPVPAAFWLFGTALIGFVSMSRRTQV